jgi:hypothetical protein
MNARAVILFGLLASVCVAREPPKQKPEDNSTVSQLLARLGEGRVGEWPSREGQAATTRYRISRLHLGASLLCIKIFATTERQAAAQPPVRLYHMEVKKGSFNFPETTSVIHPLSAEDYQRLVKMFVEQELFSLPPDPELLHDTSRLAGFDGQTWVFECWGRRGYRVVKRWSPEAGPARVCSDFIMQLVGGMKEPQ